MPLAMMLRPVMALVLVGASGIMMAGPEASEAEWVTVPPQSLEIAQGSPLDFSALATDAPAGSHGALGQASNGTLTFADNTLAPRFGCALLASGLQQQLTYPTHAEADRLALQLRRHGYTLARLHNVDYLLTGHHPGGIDPEQLDRLRYLMAALKRNGIYWMADVLTQPEASLDPAGFLHRTPADALRLRLYNDSGAQATWLVFLDAVYNTRNPYTGITPLADPALAFVTGANENSLNFALHPGGPWPKGMDTAFDAFIRKRYPTPAAITAAFPDATDAEKSGSALFALPGPSSNAPAASPRLAHYALFASHAETTLYGWMKGQLASRGFTGPLLAYPEQYAGLDNRTRSTLPITDLHLYVGEVTNLTPGSEFLLNAPTERSGMGALLTGFGERWLDRPALASEFGLPYPGRYRGEAGMLFSALAAFQGWTTTCQMAFLPVELDMPAPSADKAGIRSYAIGLDPALRAQETLSALLFQRGDLSTARHRIAIPFGENAFRMPGSALIANWVKHAALLTGIGLATPDTAAAKASAGRTLLPGAPPPTTFAGKVENGIVAWVTGREQGALSDLVAGLRSDGTLPPNNQSDPAKGVFQSENGQITVDQPHGQVRIVTPRTVAVASSGDVAEADLGAVSISGVAPGTLAAASALDDADLASSHRILLILSGDARNHGLDLAAAGVRQRLVSWGKLPVEMERVHATVTLHRAGAAKLTALALNGAPLTAGTALQAGSTGQIQVPLDTGAVAGHPTTFFLLETGTQRSIR